LNFVMSGAKAYLDDTDPIDGSMSVGAVGSVSVSAEDKVEIYSNVKLVSSSITTNDGGASILGETVNDFVPADYESSEKVREIDFGDRVRLTDDYPTGDYGTADGEIDLAVGETVKLAGTYAKGGNAGSVYKYIGADGKVDLGDADYSDADLWQEIGGNEGSVYQYMGTTATVDLSVEDYRDLRYWKEVMETQLIPQGNNLTDSDSSSTGGVVSLNQLDSEATAYIENTVVTAHAVSVSALENVTVSATTDGWFQSSGGGLLGNGKSVAEGGAASVNIIFTEAQAWVVDSALTGRVGDVRVEAKNTSTVAVKTKAVLESAGNTKGGLLAINVMGYDIIGLLYAPLDAILGEVAENLFGIHPILARAYVEDSRLDAGGDVIVRASNEAQLSADVSNEVTAMCTAMHNAKVYGMSWVVAMNMVSGEAEAWVKDTDINNGKESVIVGGVVIVEAKDQTGIEAKTVMGNKSKRVNDLGTGLLLDFVDNILKEYQYTPKSGDQEMEFGDKALLVGDYGTGDGEKDLVTGDTVTLNGKYKGGGEAGSVFSCDIQHYRSRVDYSGILLLHGLH